MRLLTKPLILFIVKVVDSGWLNWSDHRHLTTTLCFVMQRSLEPCYAGRMIKVLKDNYSMFLVLAKRLSCVFFSINIVLIWWVFPIRIQAEFNINLFSWVVLNFLIYGCTYILGNSRKLSLQNPLCWKSMIVCRSEQKLWDTVIRKRVTCEGLSYAPPIVTPTLKLTNSAIFWRQLGWLIV